MTPDAMRDQARRLDRLALANRINPFLGPWHDGRASGLRSAARFLRQDAAREEGFEVSVILGGPRSVAYSAEWRSREDRPREAAV